jgi:hypothetical protein
LDPSCFVFTFLADLARTTSALSAGESKHGHEDGLLRGKGIGSGHGQHMSRSRRRSRGSDDDGDDDDDDDNPKNFTSNLRQQTSKSSFQVPKNAAVELVKKDKYASNGCNRYFAYPAHLHYPLKHAYPLIACQSFNVYMSSFIMKHRAEMNIDQ